MRDRRSLRWLLLGLLLVGALGVGLCCVPRESDAPATAAPAPSNAGNERAAPLEPQPPAVPTEEDDNAAIRAASEPQEPAAEDAPGGSALNPVATFMRNSDKHDRELLASVERETKKSPSPEVLELLALRRSGASMSELEQFIDTELASDIRVRAAARRWLRESTGGEAPASSPPPGQGGGERKVQPIAPR
jgi:hypothetical protein